MAKKMRSNPSKKMAAYLSNKITSQPHAQTEEELEVGLSLLIAVGVCTENELFTDWHQSLQSNIQGLMSTLQLLQKQTAIDNLSGLNASLPLCTRSKGGSNPK